MKKITGSYYTPIKLANFIVRYLHGRIKEKVTSILEPSVGDGVFVEALYNSTHNLQGTNLTLFDINAEELSKAEEKAQSSNVFSCVNSNNKDFLSVDNDLKIKFSFIVGNPPYIKKKSLPRDVVARCEEHHKRAGLSDNKINNIWTAFVVSCTQQLNDDGVMALVLPADLLQVKYAEEIRLFLEKEFSRLEIFTLNDDDFPGIEQEIIVLFAYKESANPGTFFYEVSDFDGCDVQQISSNGLMVNQSKWTHYNLKPSEIHLLNSINEKLPRVSDYVDVRAGIVTGANKFFILSKKEVGKKGGKSYALPVLRNSSFVKQGVDFTHDDFEKIAESSKPAFLLDLSKKTRKNKNLDDYLDYGKSLNIHNRHKCSLRNEWYHIPNIGIPAEAFFFKRIHLVPKVIRNLSSVYVTDTAYKIDPKESTDLKSFVRSFYTVITFIYAELMGRKYGGGVLELTPNEFKDLPLLYWETKETEYDDFSGKVSFDKIEHNWLRPDALKSKLGLSDADIQELTSIHLRLVASRTQYAS